MSRRAVASTRMSVRARRCRKYASFPARFCSTTTTSTPGSPARMKRALRCVVARLRRPLDRVLADPAGTQHRDADRRARGREQRRPPSLEGVEGCREAVARHVTQVLDEAPAVVAGDHVQRNRLDPQAPQQLDALRPRREVEHREQDRATPDELVPSLGRPEHEDDVLAVRRRLIDDVHPRRHRRVGVVRVAHAGPAAGLHEAVDIQARERGHERGQERPPFAGLVVHAREADRESAVVGHLLPLGRQVIADRCTRLHRG